MSADWREGLDGPAVTARRVKAAERNRVRRLSRNSAGLPPHELAWFPNLGHLSLQVIDDRHLPPLFGRAAELPSLVWLTISGLQDPLPEEIGRILTLRRIDLRGSASLGQGPSSLPDALWSLPALEELRLTNGRLARLSDAIRSARSLRLLDLRGNPLSDLPPSLGELPSLRVLDIGEPTGLSLERVLPIVARLPDLRSLRFRARIGPTLPEEIGALPRIEYLDLGGELEALPEATGRLSTLRWLAVGSNDLQALPESLAALPALEGLDLSENPRLDLEQACEVIARSPSLREVWLPRVASERSEARLGDAGFVAPNAGRQWVRGGEPARRGLDYLF